MSMVLVRNITEEVQPVEMSDGHIRQLNPGDYAIIGEYDVNRYKHYQSLRHRGLTYDIVKNGSEFDTVPCVAETNSDTTNAQPTPIETTVQTEVQTEVQAVTINTDGEVTHQTFSDIALNDTVFVNNLVVLDNVDNDDMLQENVTNTTEQVEAVEKPKRGRKKKIDVDVETETDKANVPTKE